MGEGHAATSPMSSPTPPIRSLCWLLPLRRLRFADVHVAQGRRVILRAPDRAMHMQIGPLMFSPFIALMAIGAGWLVGQAIVRWLKGAA